jgi:hypothetical protein
MNKPLAERQQRWQPPPRPEWLTRINEEGAAMDIRAIVPLDAESLLASAVKNTGLSDFGSEEWREPFEIIARVFDEEAELNLMGRLACRSDLLIFLEARLRVEDTYRRHPEIEDEVIEKPLFIVGQGRSGTSAMLNLLARDPNNGAVLAWEATFPCPPPETATYLTDPRIERADKLITQWVRLAPTLAAIHEFGGAIPAECVQLQALSFISIWFNLLGQIPSYVAYMARADWQASYRYHKRLLKLLQWRNPRRHWVLKSTEHLRFMPVIREVYPDACFIWPHRDPVVAVASSTNLAGTLNWMRSDFPFKYPGFEQYNRPEFAVLGLEAPIDWMASGVLPSAQLCSTQYADFIRDPIAVVAQIYRHFGIEFDRAARAAMETYMREQPRSARPAHEYEKGSPELIAHERKIFQRYQTYFNVPNEV